MPFPRFYPILDTGLLAARGMSLPDAAGALLDAGARIVQIRHKHPYSRAIYEDARKVAALAAATGAMLVINDRADIAALLGAGLHVGQDDLHPDDARRVIGPSAMLGFSTHNETQMREALSLPVTYVAFGPVFATRSKQNPDPTVGLELLSRVRAMTQLPLVAIGGLTRETAPSVLAAGADSIAVIGDLYPELLDASALGARAKEWLQITGG